MAKLDSAEEIAARTTAGASGKGQKWLDGLKKSQGTIVVRARGAAARWAKSMQDAISNGSFEKGLAGVTDADIIAAAERVGGNAWENGLTSRQDKIAAAWRILGPKMQSLMDKVNAMPSISDGDRDNRALAMMRGLREIGKGK